MGDYHFTQTCVHSRISMYMNATSTNYICMKPILEFLKGVGGKQFIHHANICTQLIIGIHARVYSCIDARSLAIVSDIVLSHGHACLDCSLLRVYLALVRLQVHASVTEFLTHLERSNKTTKISLLVMCNGKENKRKLISSNAKWLSKSMQKPELWKMNYAYVLFVLPF